jgi:hypothetical protein
MRVPKTSRGRTISSDRAEERGSRTHQGLLATPAGFEVRPLHQESVLFPVMRIALQSCLKTISCCMRGANYTALSWLPHRRLTNQMAVLNAPRKSNAIEKFQNFDGEFATCADTIAKRCDSSLAAGLG